MNSRQMLHRTRVASLAFTSQPVYEFLLLLAITLVATILRFYKLGQWSFWEDEVFTISNKEDGFNYSIWRRSLATDLIRATVGVLGTSEWSARLIPAIIGIISIPVLYLLIRQILDSKTALATSALLAVSPWHLYWSQNARFYTLLLLFYSLALLTFFIGFERDQPGSIVLSLLFLGLAARERLVALFFIPVILIYLLLLLILPFERPPGFRSRNFVLFFSPLLLLGLLFAWPYLVNIKDMIYGFGRVNNNPAWIFSGVVYYVGLPIVALAAFGALYFLIKRNRAALFFSLGALIPVFGVMAVSLFVYTANRYAFISLSSFLILAGMVVIEIFTRLRQESQIIAIGVLAILILTSTGEDLLYFQFQNGNRADWKNAFSYIQQHQEPGDLVYTSSADIGDYYLPHKTKYLYRFDAEQASLNGNQLWFIEDLQAAEIYPQETNWVIENSQLMATFDVTVHARNFKMRVYRYRPERVTTSQD